MDRKATHHAACSHLPVETNHAEITEHETRTRVWGMTGDAGGGTRVFRPPGGLDSSGPLYALVTVVDNVEIF